MGNHCEFRGIWSDFFRDFSGRDMKNGDLLEKNQENMRFVRFEYFLADL